MCIYSVAPGFAKRKGFCCLEGLSKRCCLEGLAEPSVEFELQQAIGEGLPAGCCFAASYWGNPIRGVFFLQQAIGKSHLRGLFLQQAIGEVLVLGFLLFQVTGEATFTGLFLRRRSSGTPTCKPWSCAKIFRDFDCEVLFHVVLRQVMEK